jgi:hypothetical protein
MEIMRVHPGARRREGGFTLIDLLFVIALIGLLSALAVPGLMRARGAAQACLRPAHRFGFTEPIGDDYQLATLRRRQLTTPKEHFGFTGRRLARPIRNPTGSRHGVRPATWWRSARPPRGARS